MGRKLLLYNKDTKVHSFWPEVILFCQLCRTLHPVGVSLPGSTVATFSSVQSLSHVQLFATLGGPKRLRQYRNCLQCRRPGFDPWVGKIPWRKQWLFPPVFLPGEFHGQRSLGAIVHRVAKSQT